MNTRKPVYGGHRVGESMRLPNNPIWWHFLPRRLILEHPGLLRGQSDEENCAAHTSLQTDRHSPGRTSEVMTLHHTL